MAKISDDIVGAIALDIAQKGSSPLAATLLANAVSVNRSYQYFRRFGDTVGVLTLILPLDYMDRLDSEASRAILGAANRAGVSCRVVNERLAPVAEGWRDRLAELEDWGQPTDAADEWVLINERVGELKALFSRSVTPDDLADVGRRCRELMIAAASATYRPSMLPKGQDPPKDSDAKTKCKYIIKHVGSNSLDERLSTLIDKAWDLAAGLTHHKEPARTATYAAAQSAILVVRTLALIEADLVAAGEA